MNKKQLLKQLQNNYMLAKAHHETVKEIDKEVKEKVLNNNIFLVAEEWKERREEERIIDPKSDYLMEDEDFIKYCKLVHEELLKEGLNIPDYNTTADFETFPQLKEAEEELLNIGIDIVVDAGQGTKEELTKVSKHWKHREEMINLVLRLDL